MKPEIVDKFGEKIKKFKGGGKVFTTAELKLLKRADLPDFEKENYIRRTNRYES